MILSWNRYESSRIFISDDVFLHQQKPFGMDFPFVFVVDEKYLKKTLCISWWFRTKISRYIGESMYNVILSQDSEAKLFPTEWEKNHACYDDQSVQLHVMMQNVRCRMYEIISCNKQLHLVLLNVQYFMFIEVWDSHFVIIILFWWCTKHKMCMSLVRFLRMSR